MPVGDNLHFDMSRIANVLLKQNGIVAKGPSGFLFGLSQGRLKIWCLIDTTDSPPSPTGTRLDQ